MVFVCIVCTSLVVISPASSLCRLKIEIWSEVFELFLEKGHLDFALSRFWGIFARVARELINPRLHIAFCQIHLGSRFYHLALAVQMLLS